MAPSVDIVSGASAASERAQQAGRGPVVASPCGTGGFDKSCAEKAEKVEKAARDRRAPWITRAGVAW